MKLRDIPVNLRLYLFHGVDLLWENGDKQAVGNCPFCLDLEHFSVNIETSRFQCWKCSIVGNSISFLRRLWEESDKATGVDDYQVLAIDRGLTQPETVVYWGCARSIVDGTWLVPAYEKRQRGDRLVQLYRYQSPKPDRKRVLMAPSGTKHQLLGVQLYKADASTIYLCEGPWDAMALWELLGSSRYNNEDKLVLTGDKEQCLLSDASVLAVPGANVFNDKWCSLFAGKDVVLAYDNDHPRGKANTPAGFEGLRKVAGMLYTSLNPPATIRFRPWGPNGYNPDLPHGYDLRDDLLSTMKGAT